MSTALALELKNLAKTYARKTHPVPVLRGADLDVVAGTWVAVTGKSGCGKSTLLQLAGALDKPDSGQILCFGAPVTEMGSGARARFRRQRIGFIFQSYQLLPGLTACENVMVAARLNGKSRSETLRRADSLLEKVGLRDRSTHRPAELSGGEQQRIAIARALVNDPDIILADEPTGNLDSENAVEIIKILTGLRDDEGKTIVMVTHDMSLTEHADQTYVLSDGVLGDLSAEALAKA
jgi:ABC-type lipoprotein export system ATPase subunit